MQSASSRIWTCVAVSISYVDNHYTTGTSQVNSFFHSGVLSGILHILYDNTHILFLLANWKVVRIDLHMISLSHNYLVEHISEFKMTLKLQFQRQKKVILMVNMKCFILKTSFHLDVIIYEIIWQCLISMWTKVYLFFFFFFFFLMVYQHLWFI